MKSAEFGIACADRVRRNLRRLSGDPMPVEAFVQSKAFLVTLLVCAPDALVDEGSICSHLGRAVLVAVPVLPDLEKS
jgi:copper chaperone CopZ